MDQIPTTVDMLLLFIIGIWAFGLDMELITNGSMRGDAIWHRVFTSRKPPGERSP